MASNSSPRKIMKAKRILPPVPPESPRLKSVTFNNEIVETSIGGTQRVGKIKQDVLLHFDTPITPRNSGGQTPRGGNRPHVSGGHHGKENKKVNGSVDSNGKPVSSSQSESSSEEAADVTKKLSNKAKPWNSTSKQSQNSSKLKTQSTDHAKKDANITNGKHKPPDDSFSRSSKDRQPLKTEELSGKESREETHQRSSPESGNGTSSKSAEWNDRVEIQTMMEVEASDDKTSECSHIKNTLETKFSLRTKSDHSLTVSTIEQENELNVGTLGEDRRTTINRIETVCQSPFRIPDGRQSRRHTLESRVFSTPDCYRDVTLGTPRRLLPAIQDESVEEESEEESATCSIMVAVRVRPFGQRELSESSTRCVVSMKDNETAVTSENGVVHRFAYDFSFWSHDKTSKDFCGQEEVYTRLAQPLLGKAFEGYNTCLFAYGQTGSGKSYCIMGHAGETGIIPRFCEELFQRADNLACKKQVKVNVEISFFEIYNEKIHDLLAASKDKGQKKATLKVREHPVLGPYVEALSTYVVNSFDDVESWITLGNKNRATAATGMNDKSSRSHSVFSIVLTQTKTETIEGHEHDHSVNSKINLVDLAGSERQSQAKTTGERFREGANINKSLLTLGKVISLLAERSGSNKKRKIFIPYRDSVLTWLLKESLGGNSKTAMIATISPASQHMEETLSTLRYAYQARSIVNRVHINEDPKAKIIRQLRAEIERLRGEQGGGNMNEEALAASMAEVSRLRGEMEEMSRSWQERLRQAEARKAEELHQLERAGVTFKVDNRLPNLVNLNEDPQLSEMLLYVLKDGETRVGRDIDDSRHIKLTGALIADKHCVINSEDGQVVITPVGDAPTYVNGNLIAATTTLHHADRVVLGGDHYFRFNHPMEVRKNKTGSSESRDIKDFDFAKQELVRVQEARLQAELEAVMEKTRQELNEQKDGYESKLKGLEKVLTKVEETHKEAQSTIHSLQKKNMMLEQEVLAGRKRHKLESSLSQQAVEEITLGRSKIKELLESETKKVAEHLDKLRNKRSEMSGSGLVSDSAPSTPAPTSSAPAVSDGDVTRKREHHNLSTPSRRDLYKIALLVREANKINQYLNTNLVFSREDVSDEDDGRDQVLTQIRVSNTKHRMYSLWTLAKFEAKLTQMRDLYQNEGGVSADDDEVFNDPEDVWEKETSLSSPVCGLTGLRGTPRSNNSARATPVLALRKGCSNLSSPRSQQQVDIVGACKALLGNITENLSALSFEESIMDKVLTTCQRIKCNVGTVVSCEAKKHGTGESVWVRPMLQLAADVPLLASHTSLWPSCFLEGLQVPFLRDLLARAADHVKVIGHQATSLLQGCDGCLTSLMTESGHKLTSAVLALCETCGQLALATDSPVLRLDQTSHHYQVQLYAEVCEYFLQGCTKFAKQAVTGGVSSLDQCERKASALGDQSLNTSLELGELSQRLCHVLSCTRELMHRSLASLDCLAASTEGHGVSPVVEQPPQYYSASYKLQQGVVSSVASVVDSATLLTESAEGSGTDSRRLQRCCELIQRGCQRLQTAVSCTYTVEHMVDPALHDPASSSQTDTSKVRSLKSSNMTKSDEIGKQGPGSGNATKIQQSQPQRTSSPIPLGEEIPIGLSAESKCSSSSVSTVSNSSGSFLSSSSSATSSVSSATSSASSTTLSSDTTVTAVEDSVDATLPNKGSVIVDIVFEGEQTGADSEGVGGTADRSTVSENVPQEKSLLPQQQLHSMDIAVQEVAMAVALLIEYTQKLGASGDNSGAATPRGRRLLPKSPEKSVVTPAVKTAHLKKLSIKETIALASRDDGNL